MINITLCRGLYVHNQCSIDQKLCTEIHKIVVNASISMDVQ